jgi:hypothetical protein
MMCVNRPTGNNLMEVLLYRWPFRYPIYMIVLILPSVVVLEYCTRGVNYS